MSYQILDKPQSFMILGGDGKLCDRQALVSFSYGAKYASSIAHITEDDHCYIVWIWHKDGVYSPTHYIFPEALAVLKTLPDPWDLPIGDIKE